MGGIFRCNRYVCFLKLEGSHFSTARRLGFSATSPKVGVEPMVCWDWEWNSWGFSAGWWVKERGTDGWFPVVQGLNPGKKGAGWLGSCFGMMGSEPWDFFWVDWNPPPQKNINGVWRCIFDWGEPGSYVFFGGGEGFEADFIHICIFHAFWHIIHISYHYRHINIIPMKLMEILWQSGEIIVTPIISPLELEGNESMMKWNPGMVYHTECHWTWTSSTSVCWRSCRANSHLLMGKLFVTDPDFGHFCWFLMISDDLCFSLCAK